MFFYFLKRQFKSIYIYIYIYICFFFETMMKPPPQTLTELMIKHAEQKLISGLVAI